MADVLAAQSDPEALRARLGELGGRHAKLAEHERTANGVRYVLIQGVAAEQLPQAVRTLHNGDLIVHRTQTFEADGDGYTGSTTATVNGIPGEITAHIELRAHGDGALQRTSGETKIRIPLVGGKLEALVAEQITKLLERESDFTAKWLAQHAH